VLATLFGDWRETRMGAQGIIISFAKRSAGLGDYAGGYDSPDSRQRAENRNVTVLPWFVVFLIRRLKLVEQSLDAGNTTLALAVDQTQARQEQGNVFGGRLDYPRRNLQRRHPQCGNDLIRIEAANAVCAQQPLDALGSQALRNAGRWRELEQGPQPGLVGPWTQLQGLHVKAVKLFPQAVGQLIAFALQVLVYAREFPGVGSPADRPTARGESKADRCVASQPARTRPAGRPWPHLCCSGRENDLAVWGR